MRDLPPSTPIEEVFPTFAHPGVRTLGDLLVVIERGEIDDPAILRALGKEKKVHATSAKGNDPAKGARAADGPESDPGNAA